MRIISSDQFRLLAEPFLLLGEIENLIRSLIDDRFTSVELREAQDPAPKGKEVNTAADLTFGEYIRLLENPARWQKLDLQIDRQTFCVDLNTVRTIRNEIMHFEPDDKVSDSLDKLRDFARLLKDIENIRLLHRN